MSPYDKMGAHVLTPRIHPTRINVGGSFSSPRVHTRFNQWGGSKKALIPYNVVATKHFTPLCLFSLTALTLLQKLPSLSPLTMIFDPAFLPCNSHPTKWTSCPHPSPRSFRTPLSVHHLMSVNPTTLPPKHYSITTPSPIRCCHLAVLPPHQYYHC